VHGKQSLGSSGSLQIDVTNFIHCLTFTLHSQHHKSRRRDTHTCTTCLTQLPRVNYISALLVRGELMYMRNMRQSAALRRKPARCTDRDSYEQMTTTHSDIHTYSCRTSTVSRHVKVIVRSQGHGESHSRSWEWVFT